MLINTLILAVALMAFLANSPSAYAHSPHDVVTRVAIAPDFQATQTLFVIARGNLLKSQDGGSTWERPFIGLANQHNFSGLAIASESTVFLASEGDGIYKSENNGNRWIPVNEGLESLKIHLLCASRTSPLLVLARDAGNRLYLTHNGGKQWNRALQNREINAIECAQDSNALFVTDQSGVFLASTDEGRSWTEGFHFRDAGKITAIESVVKNDATLIFVGTEAGEIFESLDQGKSFAKVQGQISDDYIWDIKAIADNQSPLSLFVSTWHQGLFRSDNQGKSWTEYSRGLTKTGQADEDQRSHFKEIAISDSFQEDGILFLAGFDGLFKTSNEGKRWHQLNTLSPRSITTLSISPNYRQDATIAVGSYKEEAYISQDNGVNWTLINSGLSKVLFNRYGDHTIELHKPRFYNIEFSPNYAADQTVFAMLNYYFFVSQNAGRTWQEISVEERKGYSGRGRYMAISPNFATDQTLYLVKRYGGLTYQSTDGGRNFSILGAIDQKISSLAISPNYAIDKTLYAASANGLYKTTDGGQTWNLATPGNNFATETWHSVVFSPNYAADQTLFAGTSTGLFKTQDNGKTWETLDALDPGSQNTVKVIAVSPNYADDKTLIVGVQGKGIFKSTNAGKTFQGIASDLQASNIPLLPFDTVPTSSASIQFSPSYGEDNTVFAFGSTSADVFKSTDGGNTWNMIAIEKQANRPNDTLASQFYVGKKAVEVYPLPRMLSSLVGGVSIYFILGWLVKPFGEAKRRRLQLFAAALTFSLTFGLLSVLL
ncbi:MAG: hypothetical protein AAFY20_02640 [Cyanobacteria bacterium J06639_14]